MTEAAGRQRYQIQGREVTLPVVVRDASSGSASFLVSAAAARRLLPGPEIELAEVLPGRALCSIAIIDYRDNDLGDYNEVSIAFFVRRRGESTGLPYLGSWLDMTRGRLGTWIRHLPVDQSFTRDAGATIWGFPKTLQRIDIEYAEGRVRCCLFHDGEHALTLSLPRGGSRSLPEQSLVTYSWIEGVAHATRFSSAAQGFGVRLGGAELELHRGSVADELRGLGLPRRALMSTWMEHMRGSFEAAHKL